MGNRQHLGDLSMWRRIQQLLEMIRFSHTLFALPFALLTAVMAWTAVATGGTRTPFRWQDLLGILICMVGARSAAMAFNRLADRKLDAANPRTAGRHIPAGLLSVRSVVVFTIASSALFVAGTLLFLPNRLPLFLSLPVLGFLLSYSFTKRFTSLAHFWLGAALMLAPICVWIALRGEVLLKQPLDALPALCLGFGVLLWVTGFDVIYACQDYAFDVQTQLKSIPARLGIAGSLKLAAICHLLMIVVLAALPAAQWFGGPQLRFGWIYILGILAVAVLLLYEHSLVRPDDLTRVNIAFFHVNAIVSLGLFAVGTFDLLW
jgi:4-hydroxybenzoate polyprenyltransferase